MEGATVLVGNSRFITHSKFPVTASHSVTQVAVTVVIIFVSHSNSNLLKC